MVRATRYTLAAVLLLLFMSENLLASAREQGEGLRAHQSHVAAQEWHGSYSLLAEESEERDLRDHDGLTFVRILVHPSVFPESFAGKLRQAEEPVNLHESTPRYTRFRTLII